jgi:hypothetical protein
MALGERPAKRQSGRNVVILAVQRRGHLVETGELFLRRQR